MKTVTTKIKNKDKKEDWYKIHDDSIRQLYQAWWHLTCDKESAEFRQRALDELYDVLNKGIKNL